jgi:MFS transporter, PAT family, beta-lactamase induction signal transducer AmpG
MLSTPDREQNGQSIRRRHWHAPEAGDIGAAGQRGANLTTSGASVQSANTVGYAPRWWVPSSYFAEGVPFAIVIWVAGTMFKDLGHSDAEITIATATIGIAWSLKPLWAAFLDMVQTKKFFVLVSETGIAALLGAIALALGTPSYFAVIIGLLWVLAFASATQDICVDGIYVTSLDERRQAAWIGMQGTAWNAGRIFATAAVVFVAGALQRRGAPARDAWAYALLCSGLVMAALALYHRFTLPTGSRGRHPGSAAQVLEEFAASVRAFLDKESIWGMLAFVFLFRAGEGFLLVEAPLFLQADPSAGGLGLSLESKGLIDGTLSTTVSIVAGLLGGKFIERFGLRRTLVFMALCLNVPHLCYVVLSQLAAGGRPVPFAIVALFVCIEKFGYSFGFVANMLYMMQQIAPGDFKMTHYAFATALMNLVLIPTQSASGALADALGYRAFFLVVMLASIPSILAAWLAPFPRRAEANA